MPLIELDLVSILLLIFSMPGRPLIFVPPVGHFEINNGSSAVLQCEASAVPEHDMFWTFTNSDGSTLSIISTTESDSDKYQIKRVRGIGAGFGELTVLDVQYRDRGTYTCTAMNSVGSDVSNAILTVHGECLELCCSSALRVGVVNRSHDASSVQFLPLNLHHFFLMLYVSYVPPPLSLYSLFLSSPPTPPSPSSLFPL